jgi:hypothetical protein
MNTTNGQFCVYYAVLDVESEVLLLPKYGFRELAPRSVTIGNSCLIVFYYCDSLFLVKQLIVSIQIQSPKIKYVHLIHQY